MRDQAGVTQRAQGVCSLPFARAFAALVAVSARRAAQGTADSKFLLITAALASALSGLTQAWAAGRSPTANVPCQGLSAAPHLLSFPRGRAGLPQHTGKVPPLRPALPCGGSHCRCRPTSPFSSARVSGSPGLGSGG